MAESLSSTLAFGSEEDSEHLCQPCDRAGRKLSSTGYCTTCKEYLCQNCLSKHKTNMNQHILIRNDELLESRLSIQRHSDSFDDPATSCEKHKDQVIGFYCESHKSLICGLCKNTYHSSKDCSVQYIPNISDQTLDGNEYIETIEYLEAFIRGSERESNNLKRLITESNTSLEESVNAMKNFRRLLNEKLDNIEKAFTADVGKVSQNSYMKMREIETTCNNVIKSTKTLLTNVKELNKTKQGSKLFMELKQTREKMKTNATLIEHVSRDANNENYKFVSNKALEHHIMQEMSIGKLVRKPEDSNEPGRICAKMTDEHNKCWITGMTLMSPNVLILTDFLNKSVKMIDLDNNLITSKVNVNSPPYDITKVSTNEVAVSVPEDGHVVLMNVLSDKLVSKERLKVEGKFCRISFCRDRGFAVCYDNPVKLVILDKKGNHLLTIAKDTNGRDILAGPDDITTSFNDIFVSDRVRKAVIRLSWKGEVTGIYSRELKSPKGLAVSNDNGTLFVCENSSNSLLAISPDFKKSEVVTDNIKRPCEICFCDKTKRLFMSTSTQNKAFDNYIQIFSSM